jgi:hypothetical protein
MSDRLEDVDAGETRRSITTDRKCWEIRFEGGGRKRKGSARLEL